MKTIAMFSVKDKTEALKYAYAFMKNNELNIKECSFINPNPTKFTSTFIMPQDMCLEIYNETNLPSLNSFLTKKNHLISPGFGCVASIDKNDKKRMTLSMLENQIIVTCFEDSEKDAIKIFDRIKESCNSL